MGNDSEGRNNPFFSVLQSVLKINILNIHEVNNEILKKVLHIPIFALSANKSFTVNSIFSFFLFIEENVGLKL